MWPFTSRSGSKSPTPERKTGKLTARGFLLLPLGGRKKLSRTSSDQLSGSWKRKKTKPPPPNPDRAGTSSQPDTCRLSARSRGTNPDLAGEDEDTKIVNDLTEMLRKYRMQQRERSGTWSGSVHIKTMSRRKNVAKGASVSQQMAHRRLAELPNMKHKKYTEIDESCHHCTLLQTYEQREKRLHMVKTIKHILGGLDVLTLRVCSRPVSIQKQTAVPSTSIVVSALPPRMRKPSMSVCSYPDIVVSSVSSDDEDLNRQRSADADEYQQPNTTKRNSDESGSRSSSISSVSATSSSHSSPDPDNINQSTLSRQMQLQFSMIDADEEAEGGRSEQDTLGGGSQQRSPVPSISVTDDTQSGALVQAPETSVAPVRTALGLGLSLDLATTRLRSTSLTNSETETVTMSEVCSISGLSSPDVHSRMSICSLETSQLKTSLLANPTEASFCPSRSTSIDVSILKKDLDRISSSCDSSTGSAEGDSFYGSSAESSKIRSRSHDGSVNRAQSWERRPSRLAHLSSLVKRALAKSPAVKRNAEYLVAEKSRGVNKHRTSSYWTEAGLAAEHLWLPPNGSLSAVECYVGEKLCVKTGDKRRCAACHVVAHTACFSTLTKMGVNCKETYQEGPVKSKPTDADMERKHHWLHRWAQEGRCGHCAKSFQQKRFGDRAAVAVQCSWCKRAYHNKQACYNEALLEQPCDGGPLRGVIIPPFWIMRLLSGSAKRNALNKTKKKGKKMGQFVVKPIQMSAAPSAAPEYPLLIFVNPKSGGNKGNKLIQTFSWLLNPRQVFDIMATKGPKYGLEMYRKCVPRIRVVICGGDGTVGWVLATLDQLGWTTYPPLAVLPLGTGNDLARSMGWGGTFGDEPLTQMLNTVALDTVIMNLDRWKLEVTPNTESGVSTDVGAFNDQVVDHLPLTVMNNYFSMGADAHVALQFHQSRSANPELFNSRFKNRLAFGSYGTMDLFKRSWRYLSEHMTLECDGVDMTPVLKQSKIHCILFLNIPYYAGGTMPWGGTSCATSSGATGANQAGAGTPPNSALNATNSNPLTSANGPFTKASCWDGKIEVLGFTTAALAAVQLGGHGERLAQCSSVLIKTKIPIPAQVDGEPCLLAPSNISITFHNNVSSIPSVLFKPINRSEYVLTRAEVPLLRRVKKRGHSASTPLVLRRRAPVTVKHVTETATSTSVFIKIAIRVVAKCDYDTCRDEFAKLKGTAHEIGYVSVEVETELEQARLLVQQLLAEHPCLPYIPTTEWRYLDYVSNGDEGVFRVSRGQETHQSVSDICDVGDCLLILDQGCTSHAERSARHAQGIITAHTHIPTQTQRNVTQALRIVLHSDAKETLL